MAIEERVAKLEATVEHIQTDVERLEIKVDRLDTKVDRLNDKIDAVKDSVAALTLSTEKGFGDVHKAILSLKNWVLSLCITAGIGLLTIIARALHWL